MQNQRMTFNELSESEEFQQLLQKTIRAELPSTVRFDHPQDGKQDADVGEIEFGDNAKISSVEEDNRSYVGEFVIPTTIAGSYKESGIEGGYYDVEASDPPTSGRFTFRPNGEIATGSAADLIAGSELDVEIDDYPSGEEPPSEFPDDE